MNPFHLPVVKSTWSVGETREVETTRLDQQINVEYDSYRRIYVSDGHEWTIVGQIAKEDGKKYYILECVA